MLALCQQIEENLIQGHQNVFLLVLKGGTKGFFFFYYSIKRNLCLGILSFMNIFFHIKGFKLAALTFMINFFFTEDQSVLSQPSQVNFHDQIFYFSYFYNKFELCKINSTKFVNIFL